MNQLNDLYNLSYSKFTPDYIKLENISKIDRYLNENRASLEDFLNKYFEQFNLKHELSNKSCLELGCGIGSLSHFLHPKFNSFIGVDVSNLAILAANEIAKLKNLNINYKSIDVTTNDGLGEEFDFIIDSHLLHCLTSKKDRASYFGYIKKHLRKQGTFLLETMAFWPKIQIPVGYGFDENYILSKEINNKFIPIRSIKPSIALEEEFVAAGFHINYLYFHNELSFNPFTEFENYNVDHLPKTIRLSATLR